MLHGQKFYCNTIHHYRAIAATLSHNKFDKKQLYLDFCLHIFNSVTWLNFQSDGLASQGLDKDLHSTTQTKNQVQSGFFLDVVVAESATIFQLLASKDQTLLVWWNALLVLDLGLNVLNCVTWLYFQGDGLPCKSLDEDLHSTTQSENQMEGGFFLDVVVTQCATIFQLLASKDQTLLVWRNALLVLSNYNETRQSLQLTQYTHTKVYLLMYIYNKRIPW